MWVVILASPRQQESYKTLVDYGNMEQWQLLRKTVSASQVIEIECVT